MITEEEVFEKLSLYHKAKARQSVFNDVSDLLDRYEQKLNRQSNEMKKRLERLSKKDKYSDASLHLLEEINILEYQITETLRFRTEILERTLEVAKSCATVQEETIELLQRYNIQKSGDGSNPELQVMG